LGRAAQDASSPLLIDLISHWRLNEAAGADGIDAHDSNLLDLVTACGSVPGKIDTARSFATASNSRLAIADNPSLSFGNENFTIACWVNLSAKTLNYSIIDKYNGNVIQGEFILFYVASQDVFRWAIFDGLGGIGVVNATSFGSPPTATWIFIIAWYDADAETINIQINDGLVDSAPYGTGCHDGNLDFELGGPQALPDAILSLEGAIDSTSIWRRRLTPAERSTLWNGGNGLDYPFV
jgi:hypothetical protein